MPSLPRSRMAPVWVCPSAAPSLNRIAAGCGLLTTLRGAQVFTSPYPPASRHMIDRYGEGGRKMGAVLLRYRSPRVADVVAEGAAEGRRVGLGAGQRP